jgi:hypothetical protein
MVVNKPVTLTLQKDDESYWLKFVDSKMRTAMVNLGSVLPDANIVSNSFSHVQIIRQWAEDQFK